MYLRSGIGVGHLTRVYGGILLSFVLVVVSFTLVDCFIVIIRWNYGQLANRPTRRRQLANV